MYGNVYCEDNLYQVSKFYRVLYDTNFNLICEGEKVSKLNYNGKLDLKTVFQCTACKASFCITNERYCFRDFLK